MLRFYFVFCFLFLTCFSVHLQSPHQPCVGMPSVGVHVCVCVCARDFATSLSTHLHLNLHPAPTSCDLPVSIMRLLCPISGHKEMAVISFRGKIAYYWLGKLAKMGSVPAPCHLRRVVGHFIHCVYLQCAEWPCLVGTLRGLCKTFVFRMFSA